MGWFFGFKLHMIVSDRGELLSLMLTPGNVDDRKPVPQLVEDLFGKLFADKGYISQIEHSRHRSPTNFFVYVLCGLITYCHKPKKPSLVVQTLPCLPPNPNSRFIIFRVNP